MAQPNYQTAFGLSLGGRAMPDVTALSSGDAKYATLNDDYVNGQSGSTLLAPNGGTSAASPFWASLTTQFNVIFRDQGLPRLGYYTDLLYIAGVIAPGSFNDIQLGNNVNGFYTTGVPDRVLQPRPRPTAAGSVCSRCRRAWATPPSRASTSRAGSVRPTACCWRGR